MTITYDFLFFLSGIRYNQCMNSIEVDDSQSIFETNMQAIGNVCHEMVKISSLCGDSLRVLLASNPDAAFAEDSYGRLPLHVAVDHDSP